ncbi:MULTISPECIES: L-serine ammonia-lyase [unclassified Paraburkholderia]|uniref:L-serine ammonia-lyase n=1 Tax=unclassified Paraburkholderia TaxID=2615204 RepID=UPI002AB1378F|nr:MULTISPECIES: L-serine ammonia-lyase [unclassified Paraburkholderia]
MTASLSVFDIFKIGLGPSSSHTVGPMRAALRFAGELLEHDLLPQVASIRVDLHGSLGSTGRGHATDDGVLLGLLGEAPDTVDPDHARALLVTVRRDRSLNLLRRHSVSFDPARDIRFLSRRLPFHANGLTLSAFDAHNTLLYSATFYSTGGGFIVREGETLGHSSTMAIPFPFDSGDALLARSRESGLSIAGLAFANECARIDAATVRAGLLRIWDAMRQCVQRGCEGPRESDDVVLPQSGISRRAPALYRALASRNATADAMFDRMDWLNLFAMAVNEENAAGGRVVTAPTNGASGIVPAVLNYYVRFIERSNDDGICEFLLTAGAIGMLYKLKASISGAEVGCQGEVGVASSMAAGALAAVLGGTPEQVEHAAEIGMEHNLGLTCDPVGGLVQIPCIERNAIGAVKAVNAARMALNGDGRHHVSLDSVIRTMAQTGADMKAKYKETALGGLAVNVVLC